MYQYTKDKSKCFRLYITELKLIKYCCDEALSLLKESFELLSSSLLFRFLWMIDESLPLESKWMCTDVGKSISPYGNHENEFTKQIFIFPHNLLSSPFIQPDSLKRDFSSILIYLNVLTGIIVWQILGNPFEVCSILYFLYN